MSYGRCSESAKFLLSRTKYRPSLAIICGTGLGSLGDLLSDTEVVSYADIPHFPISTGHNHRSQMLFGRLKLPDEDKDDGGVEVMIMLGRFHLYEGYTIDQCSMPVRVMHLMGVQTLIATNAAGGLHPDYRVGDIMLLKDHVNLLGFTGVTPFSGITDERFGPRHFASNQVYSPSLRATCRRVAARLGMADSLREGVYIQMAGPQFESVAELKMLKVMGVDAVGMSTVPEALTAHQCGMTVFAFSLITNECILSDDVKEGPTAEEVIESGERRKGELRALVAEMVREIGSKENNNDEKGNTT